MKKEVDSTLYTLPLFVSSSLNWFFRLIFIMGIISSSIFVYLLIYLSITKKSDITGIVFILFFILLDACFFYVLFFYDIARKGYIEITDEYLEFPDIYRLRKFLWNEVHSVGIYYLNGNTIS